MLRVLGIAMGAMSLVILAWQGFGFHFGPFMLQVLEYYEAQAQTIFSFLEPIARTILGSLRDWFGWDLHLYAHWKHSFMLLWLYFSSWVKQAWEVGNKGSALFQFFWGGLVAFVAGALSGTISLQETKLAIAFWPIAGFIVYELGWNAWYASHFRRDNKTWTEAFREGVLWTLTRFGLPSAIAVGLAAIAITGPELRDMPNPGLALLFVLLIAVALFWLWKGFSETRVRSVLPWSGALISGKFVLQALSNGKTLLALNVFSVVGIATFLVLLGQTGV